MPLPTTTSQPLKGIYVLGALTFELARLPLWLVKYLLPAGRQHPQWSFRQALSVRVLYSVVYHIARVQARTPLPLEAGKEKERFVVMGVRDGEWYQGPMRASGEDGVRPGNVGGTWYPAPLSKSDEGRDVTVILHIHGGAYVMGDGRTAATQYFASKLLKHTSATHVMCPQYRLSTLPASKTSNPFPAALQDSLTSYLHLLHDLKIPAQNIILSGDSAGANNAIALLRYITEYGADLGIPAPSAALLWSPWIDPASAASPSTNRNYTTDYLSHAFTSWGHLAYAGPGGAKALQNAYVSMKGRPFKTQTPLFVNTGSAEVLFDDDKEWVDVMKKGGNDVRLDVTENVPHDILLVGNSLGFDKEASQGAKRAGEWLREVRSK